MSGLTGGFREKVSIQTPRPFTYPTMVVEVGTQAVLQMAQNLSLPAVNNVGRMLRIARSCVGTLVRL